MKKAQEKNKKLIRVLIILLILIMLVFTIFKIIDTYSIFESNVSGNVNVEKATWRIVVNNTDISEGTEKKFVIDQINVEGSNRIESGKIAPRFIWQF